MVLSAWFCISHGESASGDTSNISPCSWPWSWSLIFLWTKVRQFPEQSCIIIKHTPLIQYRTCTLFSTSISALPFTLEQLHNPSLIHASQCLHWQWRGVKSFIYTVVERKFFIFILIVILVTQTIQSDSALHFNCVICSAFLYNRVSIVSVK